MKIILFLALIISCSKKQDKEVIIYKQWHLSPDVSTLDIDNSLKLPQAENQIDIYEQIISVLSNGDEVVNFLSEGCEGSTKEAFSQKYNGWDLEKLERIKHSKPYSKLLAPIGMKLLAKYKSRINVYCSDDKALVKKHLLVYSDIKGLLNYYLKFNKLIPGSKNYEVYLSSLIEVTKQKEILRPKDFIKNRILSKIEAFEELLYRRNDSFIDMVKKLEGKSYIVIGGLHTQNLSSRLQKMGIKTYLKTPKGYSDQDDLLIESLKEIIKKEKQIIFSSVPQQFDINKFPIKNKIEENKLMSTKEKKSILNSLGSRTSLYQLLLSDYDRDGIRDFTLSTSEDLVIISAEDSDWDNDGVENISDPTVGTSVVGTINALKFDSILTLINKEQISALKKYFIKEKIDLVSLDDSSHLVEVLEHFKLIYNQLMKKKYIVKNIVAKKAKYTYGKQVFFSYRKGSYSLEYYPDELKKYLVKKKSEQFSTASKISMFNGFTSPLIVHSLAHELMHSRDFSKIVDFHANNWSFKELSVNSIYLSAHRSMQKKLLKTKTDLRYKNKTYKEWLLEHKNYISTLNSLLKRKNRFLELIKTTPWYTGTTSKQHEYQASFLSYNRLASVYSTHSPSEWIAESLAMCLFQKVYKLKANKTTSAKFEVLLGINPFGVDDKLCSRIKL